MNLPIALVLDKSAAYVAFQKDIFLEEWEAQANQMKAITRLGEAGGMTLFGGDTLSLLTLEDTDAVKQCHAEMEALDKAGTIAQKVSKGLFIVTPVSRNSTKKLEALVTKLGGTIVGSAPSKNEKMSTAEKLISDLNFNPATRDFLLAYVGDDYEAVIPLVKTIRPLTPKQQYGISAEELFVRLPQPPGSIPPWTLEQPIMKGDLTKTIDVFQRVSKHSHFLVVLAVLRNKFTAAYKVSAMMDLNPRLTDEKLVAASGANARSLWAVKKFHKSHGTARLQEALEIIARTEAKVKGGSAADPMITMELMLAKLTEILAR